MIQRIIGIVASLAIVAVIVFTILGSGTYKSMLPEGIFQPKAEVVASDVAQQDTMNIVAEQKEIADSIAVDSVGMEAVTESEVE